MFSFSNFDRVSFAIRVSPVFKPSLETSITTCWSMLKHRVFITFRVSKWSRYVNRKCGGISESAHSRGRFFNEKNDHFESRLLQKKSKRPVSKWTFLLIKKGDLLWGVSKIPPYLVNGSVHIVVYVLLKHKVTKHVLLSSPIRASFAISVWKFDEKFVGFQETLRVRCKIGACSTIPRRENSRIHR